MMFSIRTAKIALSALFISGSTLTLAHANPAQFFAKQYSEALGRAPEGGGWNNNNNYFVQYGCSKSTLIGMTKGIYLSAEYDSLGYDNYEKVLTATRGILNREPDATKFATWVAYLNNGNSFSSLIDLIYQSVDTSGEILTTSICRSLGYGWGTTTALTNSSIPIVSQNSQEVSTLAALQTALAKATAGSTVYLAQRAVIASSTQIVVPAGVTLATTGLPSHNKYAKQARLVQTADVGSGVDRAFVKLGPGAKLLSVWVSGQRPTRPYSLYSVPVMLGSGTGTTIQNSRVENSSGWTTIQANREGIACSAMLVDNNLVTGYSNFHWQSSVANNDDQHYTDGISGNCEDLTISNNNVIDASDVAIIVFSPELVTPQKSKIISNTIVSAGVPAYAAIMLGPNDYQGLNSNPVFTATVNNNGFWTAPDTHFDIGIMLGANPWSGTTGIIGSGGTATNNSNMSVTSAMRYGIVVDGMLNATVNNNTITRSNIKTSFSDNTATYAYTCSSTPSVDFVAHTSALVHAQGSGMVASSGGLIYNYSLDGCVYHSH